MKEKTENQLKKEKKLKAERTFPVGYTVLLVVIIAVQIGLIVLGIRYQPKPQDLIHRYDVTVQPLDDGSLDITYHFVWEALDLSEALTWVEIGMPNGNYSVSHNSFSSNILNCVPYSAGDYVSLRVFFKETYIGGDVIEFSFKVNQRDMLCTNKFGYFYEFTPGWFNAIQVEEYVFTWRKDGLDEDIWRGSLDYGEYCTMFVQYDADAFTGCETTKYEMFDGDGAYNELKGEKSGALFAFCFGAALLIIAEVYIIDCYVSYGRGRGFLTEYGAHVHVHGRTNPGYIRARHRYHARASSGRSGGRSGGCACACACACAGGGRAGCSQKDTYGKAGWRQ